MPAPRVELRRTVATPHAPVHVYGFMHGSNESQMPHASVLSSIGAALKGLPDDEYLIVEGFHHKHLRSLLEAGEDPAQVSTDAFARVFEKAGAGNAINRAERPEYYDMMLRHSIGPASRVTELLTDSPESPMSNRDAKAVEAMSLFTFPGLPFVKTTKRRDSRSIAQKLPAAKQGDVEAYVEATTTFRSLLLARAAMHRAEALGRPVHIMTGFLHSDEIEKFIGDAKFRQEYTRGLPPRLGRIYKEAELANGNITLLFRRFTAQEPARKNPAFLTALAHEVQARYADAMFERRQPQLSGIDPERLQ